jgi:hypothetical protein
MGMEVSGAGRATGFGSARRERRDRRAREKTRSQLERQSSLESEARVQGARRLGPAGRPVGEAAISGWVRAQASAYLALPPWRRAWLTWQSWGRLRRAAAVLALACVWTVVLLPLRMLGLATVEASQIGVAVLALAAPVAAFVPPRRLGRFERELPPSGPPWRSSRKAVRIRRAAVLVSLGLIGAFSLAAWIGPGLREADRGASTATGERANQIVVERVVAGICEGVAPVEIRRTGPELYAATLANGQTARVRVEFSGRAPSGSGAGYGVLVGPAPRCP